MELLDVYTLQLKTNLIPFAKIMYTGVIMSSAQKQCVPVFSDWPPYSFRRIKQVCNPGVNKLDMKFS
jgi:hypothetical protein